jgi:protein tyrosine phosphatase (PTP) superfamily phosphohydrolase (DUF442 family)
LVPTREDFANFFQKSASLPANDATQIEFTDPYKGISPEQISADKKSDQQGPKDSYNENTIFPGHIGDIQNSDTVIPGLLHRGANPGGSNDETHPWSEESLMNGLQALKDKGITVDVDFESPDPKDPCVAARIEAERKACEQLGMTFVNIPMDHSTPSQSDKDQLMTVLTQAKENGQQVYAHCREGRDRTGYMMAYVEKQLEGLSPQQAFAEEEAHGYNPYKQQKYPGLDTRNN